LGRDDSGLDLAGREKWVNCSDSGHILKVEPRFSTRLNVVFEGTAKEKSWVTKTFRLSNGKDDISHFQVE
jgi:hypothetical protein